MTYIIASASASRYTSSKETHYTIAHRRVITLFSHLEACVHHQSRHLQVWRQRHHALTALFLSLVVLLTSACSLSGISAPTTSSQTPTVQQHRLIPTTTPHTLSDIPSGIGQLIEGTPLPGNEVKSLTFNLIYDDTAFEHDVSQIYTAGSPSYHHYLTPEQILLQYTLADSQLQQVQHWLQQNSYTIDETDSLRSAIKVSATVATINRTLNIQLEQYTITAFTFFEAKGTPTLPAAVMPFIQSIVGLSNFAHPAFKPPFSIAHAKTLAGADCAKYGARQTLTRNKLAGAYQISQLYQQGMQGQGMTVGVAEFGEPYSPSDISNYATCAGIGVPNIENVDVDGHLAAGFGQGEAAMDIELIAGLAPSATILDYQADTSNTAFAQALVDVFNRVATEHRVQVLSVSYGTWESSFSSAEQSAVNRSLRTLAAEGISVFISSGDCGAYSHRLRVPQFAEVSFPASAPYAIAVGGTHLQVDSSNVRSSETAWGNDDGLPVCENDWGSGGGVSQNKDFRRPAWQTGTGTDTHYDGTDSGVFVPNVLPPTPLSAPNGLRQVPDVAAAAYPNIAIYYNGSWLASGGTSAAAPIWAAGALLLDQGLQQNHKGLLGGVPEFYALANNSASHHPYTSITQGNNLYYNATAGWNYVTGWGSPNFSDLLQLELGR